MAQPGILGPVALDSVHKRKSERFIYGFIDLFVTPGEEKVQLMYEIDQATVSIGRDHRCSIRVNNLRVSRHQCNIIQEAKSDGRFQAVLQNLTSRPTTIVESKEICDQEKIQLRDGWRFKIFDREFRWRQFNPKNPSGQVNHRTPVNVVRLSENGQITPNKTSSTKRSGRPSTSKTPLAKRRSSDLDLRKTLLQKSLRNSVIEKGTSDDGGNSSLLESQPSILEESSESEPGSPEVPSKDDSEDLIRFYTPETSAELIDLESSSEATPTVEKSDEATNGPPLSQLPDEVSPPPQGYDNVESVEFLTQPETYWEDEDSEDNFTDIPSQSAGVDAKDVETQFIIADDRGETQLIRPADQDAQGPDDHIEQDLESDMEEFIAHLEPTPTQTQPLNKSTLSQEEFDNIFDDPILEAESTSLYTREKSSNSQEIYDLNASPGSTPTEVMLLDERTNESLFNQLPDEANTSNQKSQNMEVESVETDMVEETEESLQIQPPEPEESDETQNVLDVVESSVFINSTDDEPHQLTPQNISKGCSSDLDSTMTMLRKSLKNSTKEKPTSDEGNSSFVELQSNILEESLESEAVSPEFTTKDMSTDLFRFHTPETSSNSQEIFDCSSPETPSVVKYSNERNSGLSLSQLPDEASTSSQKYSNAESSTDDEPHQLTPQKISKGCPSDLDSTMTKLRNSMRNSTKEKPTSDEANSSLVELQSNILEESLESEAVSPEFTSKDVSKDLFRFHTPETSSNSQEIFECSSPETPSVVKYSNEGTNVLSLSQLPTQTDEANTSSQKYSTAESTEMLTQHETDMDDGTEESWLNELPEESNASSHSNDNTGCVELPTKSETDRKNQNDNLGEVTAQACEIGEENQDVMPEDIELVILSDSDSDVDAGTEKDSHHQMPEETNTSSDNNDNVEPVELLTQSDNNDDLEGIEESSLNEMTEEVNINILSFRKKDSVESMELLDQSKPNMDEGTEESSLNQMMQEDNTSCDQNDNVKSSEVVTSQSESHSEEDLGTQTQESSPNQIVEEDSSVQNDNVESMELLTQPKFDRDEGTEESSLAQISEEDNTSSVENDNFESIELLPQSNPNAEEETEESSLNQIEDPNSSASPDRNENVEFNESDVEGKLLTQSEETEQFSQNQLAEETDETVQPNILIDSTVDEPQQVVTPQNVPKKCSVTLGRLILKGLTDSESEDELETGTLKTPRVSTSAKKTSISAPETPKRRLQEKAIILEPAKPVKVEAKKRSTTSKKITQETLSPRKLRKRDFVDAENWSGEESEETSPPTSKSLKLSKVEETDTVHSKTLRRGVKTKPVTPEPEKKPRGRPRTRAVTPEPEEKSQRIKTRAVTPEPEEKPQLGLKSRALTPEPQEKPQRKLKSRAVTSEAEQKPQRKIKTRAVTPELDEKPQRRLKSRALTPEPQEKSQRRPKTRAVTPEPEQKPQRKLRTRAVTPEVEEKPPRGLKSRRAVTPEPEQKPQRKLRTRAVTPEPEEKSQRIKTRAVTPEPEEKSQRGVKSRALTPEPEKKLRRRPKTRAVTPEPQEKPQRKLKPRPVTPEPEEKPQRKLKNRGITPDPDPELEVIPVRRRMSRGGEIDGLSKHDKVTPRITRMRGTEKKLEGPHTELAEQADEKNKGTQRQKSSKAQAKEISPTLSMGSKRRIKTKAVTPEPSPQSPVPSPSIPAKRKGRRVVETEGLEDVKIKAEARVVTARTRNAKNIDVPKVSLTQEKDSKTKKPAKGVEKSQKRVLKENDTDSLPAKKKTKTSSPAAEVMTSPRQLRKRTTRKV